MSEACAAVLGFFEASRDVLVRVGMVHESGTGVWAFLKSTSGATILFVRAVLAPAVLVALPSAADAQTRPVRQLLR